MVAALVVLGFLILEVAWFGRKIIRRPDQYVTFKDFSDVQRRARALKKSYESVLIERDTLTRALEVAEAQRDTPLRCDNCGSDLRCRNCGVMV